LNWTLYDNRSHHQVEMNIPSKPPGVDRLLTLIEDEANRRRQAQDKFFRCACVKIVALILAFISMRIGAGILVVWFFALIGLCAALVNFGLMFNEREEREKLAKALAKIDEVRAIGPLCETFDPFDSWRTEQAEKSLIRLLPLMTASEAAQLTSLQRRLLFAKLHSDNAPLVLAILNSLEQIGDGAALPYVEKLAEGNGKYLAATDGRIWLAAKECLPFLQERAAQERLANTLLRPAEETSHPEILLRPAALQPETAPQQLLRPTATTPETPA
jgi:hypothetical protein